MSSSRDLQIDWCSHRAAQYACEKWHYSRSMPAGKTVKVGVWEGEFRGCVIFSLGANRHLGNAFGLPMTQVCELTRVALSRHTTPVTRIISIAVRMLKRQCPGLRLIVSYADVDHGHHGGIYAGGNWVYLGMVQKGGGTPKYRIRGKVKHGRSVHSLYGHGSKNIRWLREHVDPHAEKVYTFGKHKYVMPLDPEIKAKVRVLAKQYPKRAGSKENVAPCDQPGEGGAIPTPALHPYTQQGVTRHGRAEA